MLATVLNVLGKQEQRLCVQLFNNTDTACIKNVTHVDFLGEGHA